MDCNGMVGADSAHAQGVFAYLFWVNRLLALAMGEGRNAFTVGPFKTGTGELTLIEACLQVFKRMILTGC